MKIGPITGREKAVAGVTSGLRKYLEMHLFPTPQQAAEATTVLTTGDGDRIVEFVRSNLVWVTDRAMLNAASQSRQQTIHRLYQDTRFSLQCVDHDDWQPNPQVWKEAQAFTDDDLKGMAADGGYRAIHADSDLQLKWQDVLDHVLQERFFSVRNWVRGLQHQELPFGPTIALTIDNEEWKFEISPRHAGAGRNVVALDFLLWKGDRTHEGVLKIEDRMVVESSGMREFLERYVREATATKSLVAISDQQMDSTGLHEALPDDGDRYTTGYRDALESMSLALSSAGVTGAQIQSAVDVAVEAFGNNFPEEDLDAGAPSPTMG